MSDSAKSPISVIIPTKDEERNIADCIESVNWCGEIFVFDSMSSDRTTTIAEKLGARIVQKEFDSFSSHKNWALTRIPFRHKWILILDADERVVPELKKEIKSAIKNDCISGYYIPRMNFFMGKWIRHGGWFPDYQLRLFKHGEAKYDERIVHEHMTVKSQTKLLHNPLIHQDFKGLERYFDRHNAYSSLEAIEALKVKNRKMSFSYLKDELLKRNSQRRRILKEIAYRYLPCRCLLKFFWMYIIRFGFLDGRMGFRYCLLHTFYEYQISLKLEELNDPQSPMVQKYKSYM